jgi:hypothetical protein
MKLAKQIVGHNEAVDIGSGRLRLFGHISPPLEV